MVVLLCQCEKDLNKNWHPGEEWVDPRDGNAYQTILVLNQTWMAENLSYTTDSGSWVYDNNQSYDDTYGRLYDWETACMVCPDGWHLPDDTEVLKLIDHFGEEYIAGGKLKEAGTLYWLSPNTGATNESGFTALPGGYRGDDGKSYGMGDRAYFWSSFGSFPPPDWDPDGPWSSMAYVLSSDDEQAGHGGFNIGKGFSVRCVKD